MLLVITPSAKALGSVQAIQQITSEEIHVAATSSHALARLRAQEYVALLLEQAFMETEPVESDMMLEHIGTAVPVQVNFAINGMDRVARELRAAFFATRGKSCWSGRRYNKLCETNSRARLQHCCFPARWHCKFPIFRAKPRTGGAAPTNLPGRYASSSQIQSDTLVQSLPPPSPRLHHRKCVSGVI